jgi:hypothetical protein
MSPDPLIYGDISDPQTLNRYVYVRDSPVNLVDPAGLFIGAIPDTPCIPCDIGIGLFDLFSLLFGFGGGAPPPVYHLDPPHSSGDPFSGETNGIPNGLQVPGLGAGPFGGCSYGSGSCGGVANGLQAAEVAAPLVTGLEDLLRLLWPISLANRREQKAKAAATPTAEYLQTNCKPLGPPRTSSSRTYPGGTSSEQDFICPDGSIWSHHILKDAEGKLVENNIRIRPILLN